MKEIEINQVVPVGEKGLQIGTTDQSMVEHNLQALNKVAETIKKSLVRDTDYGKIQGLGNKDCLFKPGAEKIYLLFGLTPKFTIINQTTTKEYVSFQIQCDLELFGERKSTGLGLANSIEKKWARDPLGNANTILKIAKKRAMVDSVIGIGCLSTIFTQDLEDIKANGMTFNDKKEGEVSFEERKQAMNEFCKVLGLNPGKNKDLANQKQQKVCQDLELGVESIGKSSITKEDFDKFMKGVVEHKLEPMEDHDLAWAKEL